MTEESFNNLVDEHSPYLWVNEAKSKTGIQPIDKRFIVAAGLRWLGGHDHSCLEDVFQFSYSSSRRVTNKFIHEVIYDLNNTKDEELVTVAAGKTSNAPWTAATMGSFLRWMAFYPLERDHVRMTAPTRLTTSVVSKDVCFLLCCSSSSTSTMAAPHIIPVKEELEGYGGIYNVRR
jgi:hypothetical protein